MATDSRAAKAVADRLAEDVIRRQMLAAVKLADAANELGDKAAQKLADALVKEMKKDQDKEKKEEENKKKQGATKVKDGFDGIKALAGKLATILVPISIVSSIIGAESTGMRVFLSSIKVLGNTIGAVLTPGFVLASAAMLTLSDMISDWLLPNLEQWYEFLLTKGIEIFDWLEKEVVKSINATVDKFHMLMNAMDAAGMSFKKWKDWYDTMSGTKGREAVTNNPMFQKIFNILAGRGGMKLDDTEDKLGKSVDNLISGRGTPNVPAGKSAKEFWESLNIKLDEKGKPIFDSKGGFGKRLGGNLKEVMQEFRMQSGPAPSSMGIAQASRNAQMAGLQMSPFEARQLELLSKIFDTLDRVIAKIAPPTTE